MLPGDEGASINGPSMVKMPAWATGRLGTYHLYFAHHNGTYIRLAYSDTLQGPWRIHPGGVLSLGECPFLRDHIASPDVHVDEQTRRIVMYFHGPERRAREQTTFAATSVDGLYFNPSPRALGPFYARIFRHDGWWYGLFGTGTVRLRRSIEGLSGFEEGPVVLPGSRRVRPRHVAVQKSGDSLIVYYTRKGDAPERVIYGSIDLCKDWRRWVVRGRTELLRPGTDYEGAGLPVRRSKAGVARSKENGLRDPAIFEEDGRTWLLYAIAGESGIALAEIRPGEPRAAGLRRSIANLWSRLGV
ncbi:hypothetical protein CK220_01675 [Mesorhizobium sp. WSM3860]|nr:hypothetical protein CK220_01675 [Mesorhizobium sp. WSM3860]